jgi:hypothetical protein
VHTTLVSWLKQLGKLQVRGSWLTNKASWSVCKAWPSLPFSSSGEWKLPKAIY